MDLEALDVEAGLGAVEDETRIGTTSLRAFSAILLALLVASGFLGNMFLLATLLSSDSLRRRLFCLGLANVALVNLLEVGANMFVSLIYVSTGEWRSTAAAEATCKANAALGVWVGLELLLGLCFLSGERAFALLAKSYHQRRLGSLHGLLLILGLWALGAAVTVPLAAGLVPVRIFPARYFCAVAELAPLGYSAALIAVYVLAFAALLAHFALILRKAHKVRLEKRILFSERIADYTDRMADFREFLEQLELGKLCLWLFLPFVLLHGPYLVLSLHFQLLNASPPLTQLSSDAETAITWLKFLYPVIFPVIIFFSCRDIWSKFKTLFCCRKGGHVAGLGTMRELHMGTIGSLGGTRGGDGPAGARDLDSAPTLVATTGGLHLRSVGVDNLGLETEEFQLADVGSGRGEGRAAAGLPPASADAATSDYDSEDSWSWATEVGPSPRLPRTSVVGNVQRTKLQVLVHPRTDFPSMPILPHRGRPSNDSGVGMEMLSVPAHRRSKSDSSLATGAADRIATSSASAEDLKRWSSSSSSSSEEEAGEELGLSVGQDSGLQLSLSGVQCLSFPPSPSQPPRAAQPSRPRRPMAKSGGKATTPLPPAKPKRPRKTSAKVEDAPPALSRENTFTRLPQLNNSSSDPLSTSLSSSKGGGKGREKDGKTWQSSSVFAAKSRLPSIDGPNVFDGRLTDHPLRQNKYKASAH